MLCNITKVEIFPIKVTSSDFKSQIVPFSNDALNNPYDSIYRFIHKTK